MLAPVQFQSFCIAKAASAGRRVVLVDPRMTSQQCSGCGAVVPKRLEERTHSCPHCGLVIDRDHNAAINILFRGEASGPRCYGGVEAHPFRGGYFTGTSRASIWNTSSSGSSGG